MKKILLATLGLLPLMTIATTYADDVQPVCNDTGAVCQLRQEIDTARNVYKSEIQALRDQMVAADKKNFHANFGEVRKFLAKPLTGEQRKVVNDIIKSKDKAMKALQKATNALVKSGTVDRNGYITQATEILTTCKANLLPYIAADKTAGFDAFIQARTNAMINNVTARQIDASIRAKKAAFKERLRQKKEELKSLVEPENDD